MTDDLLTLVVALLILAAPVAAVGAAVWVENRFARHARNRVIDAGPTHRVEVGRDVLPPMQFTSARPRDW